LRKTTPPAENSRVMGVSRGRNSLAESGEGDNPSNSRRTATLLEAATLEKMPSLQMVFLDLSPVLFQRRQLFPLVGRRSAS
jgi:hypothetical protein